MGAEEKVERRKRWRCRSGFNARVRMGAEEKVERRKRWRGRSGLLG